MTPKRNIPRSLPIVHRPSSVPKICSFRRFRHFALCILHVELPLRVRPPDNRGSPCPLSGPCSGIRCGRRNSAGNGNRLGRSNRRRSGLLTWYRIGAGSTSRSSACSWFCTCALSRTRSSCRNTRRSCFCTAARSGLCNCIRFGCRSGARSGPCNRPTNSSRSSSCNSPQSGARLTFLATRHSTTGVSERSQQLGTRASGACLDLTPLGLILLRHGNARPRRRQTSG